MFGFYVILTLDFLYIALIGGVIGYLIGKYLKKEVVYEDKTSKEDNESKATDEKEQSLVSCNKSSLLED